MITGELKSKVDRIWDTMWSGGVSNPLSVIEQLTYLLFIKRLDELQTLAELKANRSGKPIESPVFDIKQQPLRWSSFKDTAPEQMFTIVRDKVFPFIKTLGSCEDGIESTYAQHMKDAMFMMPSPRVLANVVDQLDSIDMSSSDTKGDLYEYMLGKIASAGQNGQFRTPRHIIELMVDMTAPTPKDVICDPACGTAGFLVAAAAYLSTHHGDAIYRNAKSRKRFNGGTFHGFDFDTTMLRIGSMNMLLHGVENPEIRYKDSLAETLVDDSESYSLILANPPFSGSLDYESTAKDLLNTVKTKKTELLFVALIKKFLKSAGRAAIIVPAGVLEAESKSHRALRKMLVEEMSVKAIIRLPHWVFKPYASVDTSIVIIEKSGTTKDIWFYRVENDGFNDDAAKTESALNDLPELKSLWHNPQLRNSTNTRKTKHTNVPVKTIRENLYDLSPALYLSGHEYPQQCSLVSLDEIFHIKRGTVSANQGNDEGAYPFFTSSEKPRRTEKFVFDSEAICIPIVSSTGHGHASIKTVHYISGKFNAASITAVLLPKSEKLNVLTLFYYLLAHKDTLLVPLMRGATNKSLNLDRLASLQVPIFSEKSKERHHVTKLIETRSQLEKAKIDVADLQSEHRQLLATFRCLGTPTTSEIAAVENLESEL